MAKFTFADRYAEAGLSPSAERIISRQEPAKRIVDNITDNQVLDLVAMYYGSTDIDLGWFRDEFATEDASFSLVNNERETRVLAALILGELIDEENAIAILAVCVGGVKGHRPPPQSAWLLIEAEEMLRRLSVADRIPEAIEIKATPTLSSQLTEDITGMANDWASLIAMLGKIRTEAHNSARTTAAQVKNALNALDRQAKFMREESQMLWWLIGGHSRTFERSFKAFGTQQAALVGALDLGALTTQSEFGPVAIPAMLERAIAAAKTIKGQQPRQLATAIDGFTAEDLAYLEVPTNLPERLAPVTTAIQLAKTMSTGSWYSRFHAKTGLNHSIEFDSVLLAEQLYRECLLGQLL